MTEKIPNKSAFDAALILLARREHSQQEIYDKLSQKGHEQSDVSNALAQLIEMQYQSDERFAHAYARSRYLSGKGPVRIAQELAQRGVASHLIEAAMANPELDWFAQAVEVRVRKFGDTLPVDFKDKAKQMRFLQYRGFSGEQISYSLT